MRVTVKLSTQQEQYVAGDVIEGVVNLTVATSKPEGVPANDFTLKLVGKVNTAITHDIFGTGMKATTTQCDEFLSYEMKLRSFDGAAANGTYSFPFSVMLPLGLPSSMKERKDGDECSIEYGLEAELDRPNLFRFDAKDKKKIKIFNKPQDTAANVPIRMEPETATVRNWCCSSQGRISLGVEVDRSVVRIKDPAKLTVAVRNDSPVPVGSLRIEVGQMCTWRAGSHARQKKRTFACTTVPGIELGEVEHGQGAPVVADAARQSLREMQAAGAGTHHELLIPEQCLQSLRSTLIQVCHTLTFRLETESGPSAVNVWTPIHVQAADVLLLVPPETKSIGLPSVEASAGEGLGLLSVPQSEVKFELGYELPQPLAPST